LQYYFIEGNLFSKKRKRKDLFALFDYRFSQKMQVKKKKTPFFP